MAILELVDTGGYKPILIFVVATSLLLLYLNVQLRHDAQEPPLVRPKFPLIGHLVGMLWHGTEYHPRLAQENPGMPVFTIPILPFEEAKMYIITSPQLVQQAFRKKSVDFDPITIAFAAKMVGFSSRITELMKAAPSHSSTGFLSDQHKVYELLAPGPTLQAMNANVLNSISDILDSVGSEWDTKRIYLWLRDTFTLATTTSLFGVTNPITEDPKLNESLWVYEGGAASLLAKPFPSLTARRPYYARDKLQKALRAYLQAGHDQNSDVSSVIKQRIAINRQWGLPPSDVADHELGMLFVSITNAIPTLFWMVCYVFRDQQLVKDLREEVRGILEERQGEDGRRQCVLAIAKFSTSCPLLVSSYQEVIRLTNRQMGTRKLTDDTILEYTPTDKEGGQPRTYLLKRGASVQMPVRVTHYLADVWGDDAYTFKPRRWITSREQERVQKRAFNPFGGGKHLCPGRHFAYAEVLGAIAALVLGFEIATPEGGKIAVPPINSNFAEAVGKPLPDVQQSMLAKIRRREGWENVRWTFVAGNGKE
ncbi:cytochrome P450 [Bisporella sp. PMI_857]|nr:cytochrome P450 [Bisporella sp. PMI_857]